MQMKDQVQSVITFTWCIYAVCHLDFITFIYDLTFLNVLEFVRKYIEKIEMIKLLNDRC